MLAHHEDQYWEPLFLDGAPRRLRRSGSYRAYVPDLLVGRESAMSASLARVVSDATADLRDAAAVVQRADLGSLVDFFVRAEATASSAIEGEYASPAKVALAGFTGYGRPAAATVARNLVVVREAVDRIATAPRVELDDVIALQQRLVPHLAGVREEAVWIGGSTPLEARYVAPPAHRVPDLLDDLLAWTNDADVDPVTRVATFHAQFETIHPFLDGNGRVGRAVAGALLARAGLGGPAVVPFSVVIARRREDYFDALSTWQDQVGRDRRQEWTTWFAHLLSEAATTAHDLSVRAVGVRESSRADLAAHQGRAVRTGSVLETLVDGLFAHPVDTATTVAQRLGVSDPAARTALERLADAGVVRRERVDRGRETAYVAHRVLALVGAGWSDPDAGACPVEPVAGVGVTVPTVSARPGGCSWWMPLAARRCRLNTGHAGRHR